MSKTKAAIAADTWLYNCCCDGELAKTIQHRAPEGCFNHHLKRASQGTFQICLDKIYDYRDTRRLEFVLLDTNAESVSSMA